MIATQAVMVAQLSKVLKEVCSRPVITLAAIRPDIHSHPSRLFMFGLEDALAAYHLE